MYNILAYIIAKIIYVLALCVGVPLHYPTGKVLVGAWKAYGWLTPSWCIAPQCTGVRSLISLSLMALVYAALYFRGEGFGIRTFKLWLSSLCLAFICNLSRILLVVSTSYYFNTQVGRTVHSYSGYVVYAIALFIMFVIGDKLKGCKPCVTGID